MKRKSLKDLKVFLIKLVLIWVKFSQLYAMKRDLKAILKKHKEHNISVEKMRPII